ncbi:MAG: DnaJ domain-containing protein [Spirochaetes bacterium]|nr:DnaJ domain-containing protein [Spirochaetota bacterium]
MNLGDCYRILGVSTSAADDAVKSAFKKLAMKYHPDKNPDKIEWATKAMSNLNEAYTTIVKYRFQQKDKKTPAVKPADKNRPAGPAVYAWHDDNMRVKKEARRPEPPAARDKAARSALYDGLYNLARRNSGDNIKIFEDIVSQLRKNYHRLNELLTETDDEEFVRHFSSYRDMTFNFYMSSECINVIDYFSEAVDFQAYRLFKKGDDTLHPAEKEIFYDRHNRGSFKKDYAELMLKKSKEFFNEALRAHPESTWAIESSLKLRYTLILIDYVGLFFSEDGG